MHCFYGWSTYVVVYIIILPRLVPLIWDWFCRISICFFIYSNSALQSFLFTNSWSNLLCCILRCFFLWASVAVRSFLTPHHIAICIQGLISVLATYWFIFSTPWFPIFSIFNCFKFFFLLLIVAQFILTFNKHFDNCSFWFIFFYQNFILFLKKVYNFVIVLLFRLVWNVSNAFLNNIEFFFDKHFYSFYFGSQFINLILMHIVVIFGGIRRLIIIV